MNYNFLVVNFLTSFVACYLANHVKINFSWKKDVKEENTTQSESTPIVEDKYELLEDDKTEYTADPTEIVGYSADDYTSIDEAFVGIGTLEKKTETKEKADSAEIVGYSVDDYVSYDKAFVGLDIFSKDLCEQEETIIKRKNSEQTKEYDLHKYMEIYIKRRDDEFPNAVPTEVDPYVN